MEQLVFVTVGTTQFDNLITQFENSDLIESLSKLGYTKILLQVGKGSVIPKQRQEFGISIDYYNFKPSLKDDFNSASLVISHAGAASCLEALEANKKLLMVVNNDLMNNHQVELAEALRDLNYCYWCYPENLCSTIKSIKFDNLTKYVPGNALPLVDYFDTLFNLNH